MFLDYDVSTMPPKSQTEEMIEWSLLEDQTAWKDKGGWAEIGSRLLETVQLRGRQVKRREIIDRGGVSGNQRGREWEMETTIRTLGNYSLVAERSGFSLNITVRGITMVVDAEKWKKMVLITKDPTTIQWGSIFDEIKNNYGAVEGKVIEENRAMFFFSSQDQVNVFVKDKEVRVVGVVLKVEKWRNEMNSMVELTMVRDRWIVLKGLPFHLKKKDIVEFIGNNLGGVVELDEETTKIESTVVRMKIKSLDLKNTPRMVTVSEKGYKYIVLIKPEFDRRVSKTWRNVVAVGGGGQDDVEGRETQIAVTKENREIVQAREEAAKVVSEQNNSSLIPSGFEIVIAQRNCEERQEIVTEGKVQTEAILGIEKWREVGEKSSHESKAVGTPVHTQQREVVCKNSFEMLEGEVDMKCDIVVETDMGSESNPSRVRNTEVMTTQIVEDEITRTEHNSKRGRSVERRNHKEKHKGLFNGLFGLVPTLVLSKRMEWAAYRKSAIKNKKDKSRGRSKSGGSRVRNTEDMVQL
ncbi:hypothetical protein FRX31_010373 [Thalictrum thalictroides]|uniref:DUF4283 domain-containing protein n=1 Tax=Thalictrum thalictroides TaxID=46969 RepID=A0A7J6WTB8_THATH|nr:hypothetical protein FRX31_010373 [Thalictrum thalictroides]